MSYRSKMTRFSLILILIFISMDLQAQGEITLEEDLRPVLEAGAFAGGFNSPVYPAAEQNQTNIIPAPYFIYRGETLRVGDGSIARAVALDESWYELDLSLGASFAANSDDNPARAGMPDLDFIFELGPQLRLLLAQFEFQGHGKSELFLNLQTRGVFSTDFANIDHRGYVFQPRLSYRQRGWLSEKTALSITIAPTWATQRLHDYFYQVDEAFVTDERAAYQTESGYLGTDLSLGFSFDVQQDVRVFLRGTLSLHGGAANEASPLFREKSTYSLGIGVVWRLWESEEKVAGR